VDRRCEEGGGGDVRATRARAGTSLFVDDLPSTRNSRGTGSRSEAQNPSRLRAATQPMASMSSAGAGAGGHNLRPRRGRGGGSGSSALPPERRRGVSPLHDLLEDSPDFFAAEMLARLGPTDCAMIAQVGHPWLAAVLAANLPRAGRGRAVPLMLPEFVGSVARLAWAIRQTGARAGC